MKKLFTGLIILTIVLSFSLALGQQKRIPPPGKEVIPSADCSWLTFYGALCQDIDDGKIYKWDGITQTELAAGASGDMTKAEYDVDANGKIDGNKIDPISADLITSGTLNISTINLPSSNADPGTTAGQIKHDTVDTLSAGGVVKWYDGTDVRSVLDTKILSANALSFITAANNAAMMTALGLTANAQTLIGETFAQMQASLSIDDLITLSGVAEGSVHLSTFTGSTITDNVTIKAALQLLETALELKAPIASPTFTGAATFPNEGLKILDTGGDHELIIKPGTDLGADRILTITTGDAARILTISGDTTVNQDVSSTANPAFATINVTGANALNVGTSRTNDGTIRFKSGTALNDFYHEIRGSNFGANTLWILPTAVPGGSNYLLNVDADGTMGYTDPASISLSLGNWKMFYSNGTGVLTEVALDVAGKVLMSNGVDQAPTMQTPSGAGDVTSIGYSTGACTSGDCLDGTSDGGTNISLYSASGSRVIRNNAGVVEIRDATDAAYANLKLNALTINTTVSGILKAASGVVSAATAGSDYPGLASANTFTGTPIIIGDSDTDLLGIRSLIYGGNSRAVQITDTLATPTYATGPTELYVKGDVEVGGIVYSVGGFESILPPGNVGYMRAKEDSAYATGGNVNFRGFTMLDADYTQDLEFTFPTGLNSANDLMVLGAPALNKSAMSFSGLASLMGTVFGTTQGSILYRSGSAWIALAPDTAGKVLQTGGGGANPSWATITATAAGASGNLQYNSGTNTLAAEVALSYNSTTNTLGIIQNGTDPTLTTGDGTYTWVYTPQVGVEGVLEVQGGAYISTLLMVPNGANPTTNAAGEIAVDTSAGAGSMLRFYGDAAYAIPATIPGNPVIVLSPTSSSDHYYMFTPYAITIKAVHYLSKTGEWVGQLNICDANGGSCGATQAANTTTVAGTTTNVTSFTDATVPAGVWIALATTSVGSPAPTELIVQMDYVVDQVN